MKIEWPNTITGIMKSLPEKDNSIGAVDIEFLSFIQEPFSFKNNKLANAEFHT